tara:strand:- start:8456 stop:8965 length:510 start_codon:yes stop_codon:yes gene_type:complete
MKDLAQSLRNIKILISDVDGVMTDSRIWLNANGDWTRAFTVRDGIGIKRLLKAGIPVAIISGGKSNDVQTRMEFLGIEEIHLGIEDKKEVFLNLLDRKKLKPEECAYIGDDLPDLPILNQVAFAATVPEAVDDLHGENIYVTRLHGGQGAVREVCDLIMQHSQYAKGDS